MGEAHDTMPPPLHELEREVMEHVWSADGETSVRDVLDALNAAGGKERAYTTIMTTMHRLESKGLLERRRDGRMDVFHAAFSREDYQAARAHAQVDALVDEFGELALTQFAAQIERLDPKHRERLRRLARRG